MKQCLFIFLFGFAACSGSQPPSSESWEDGSRKVTVVKDSVVGKRNMLFMFYHERGTTDASIYFKEEAYYQPEPIHIATRRFFNQHGERDGVWKGWFINGQKSSIIHYKDGKRHGKWHTWLPDGSVSEYIEYVEDSVVFMK